MPVVKDLQVFEDVRPRFGPPLPRRLVDEFEFERREEALGDGIVPAVRASTHAGDDAVGGEPRAELVGGVLAATIRVANSEEGMNGALVWGLERPLESSGNNLRSYHRLIDELAEILADDVSSAEVAPTIFAKEDQLPPESPPLASGMGACTIEQVLAMKNSGMMDAQVKRACGQ